MPRKHLINLGLIKDRDEIFRDLMDEIEVEDELKSIEERFKMRKSKNAFEAWMKKVDAELRKVSGLTSEDLADQDYWSMFEDEVHPSEAAEEVLIEEGFPC